MQVTNVFSFNKFLNYHNINKKIRIKLNQELQTNMLQIIFLKDKDKTYKTMTIKINEHNPLTLKLLFILFIYLLATHWPPFQKIPTYLLSHISVLWILSVYRISNQNNKQPIYLKKIGEFMMGFWVRMSWTACYNLYLTGMIHGGNHQEFGKIVIECLIACAIYTSIPIRYIEFVWNNQYLRWLIFVIDQPIANSLRFLPLIQTEFTSNKHPTLIIPITLITVRSILRPLSQICSASINKNLTNKNLKKWITIGFLNTCRALFLALLNYMYLQYFIYGQHGIRHQMKNQLQRKQYEKQQLDTLRFFNMGYYGFVGYLMYLQTYTL